MQIGKVINTTVENFCIDGKCSRCGECCGDFLPLMEHEILTIQDYIIEHDIKAYKNNVIITDVDLTCPFYDGKIKKCRIYEVRPSICRVFQCDQSFEEMQKNKYELHNNLKRFPISMREAFFGEENALLRIISSELKGNKSNG